MAFVYNNFREKLLIFARQNQWLPRDIKSVCLFFIYVIIRNTRPLDLIVNKLFFAPNNHFFFYTVSAFVSYTVLLS